MKDNIKESNRFQMVFYGDQLGRIRELCKQEGHATISSFIRSLVINHVNSKLKK